MLGGRHVRRTSIEIEIYKDTCETFTDNFQILYFSVSKTVHFSLLKIFYKK